MKEFLILDMTAAPHGTWSVHRDVDGFGRVTHIATGKTMFIAPAVENGVELLGVFEHIDDEHALAYHVMHLQAVRFCQRMITLSIE